MAKDEFKVRRNMALIAFCAILLIAFYVLYQATSSCQEVGDNLIAATGLLTPIIMCLTGMVIGYGTSVHLRDQSDAADTNKPEDN